MPPLDLFSSSEFWTAVITALVGSGGVGAIICAVSSRRKDAAQIAAQAHHHLLIAKQVRDGRTYTQVAPLDEEGRELELARIIGGEVSEAARVAAREMLSQM